MIRRSFSWVRWPSGRLWLVFSWVCILAGCYGLLLAASPRLEEMAPGKPAWSRPVPHADGITLTEDRLYIPRLMLNIPYKSGGREVLNDNAWWRHPERGNPANGGNFILSAHRFELGLTPGETRRKSPFYRLDSIVAGDKIYVDYQGVRYEYEVYDRHKIRPNDTSIEAPTDNARMTLYSCTYRGSADGREVLFARQTKRDVDPTLQF